MRLDLRVCLSRRGEHRRRIVHSHHLVTERLQVARQSTLAAAQVEPRPTRRRYQLEKQIALEAPVAVVDRLPRPGNDARRMLLPRRTQVRRLSPRAAQRALRWW